jgi:hypothetical protein
MDDLHPAGQMSPDIRVLSQPLKLCSFPWLTFFPALTETA